MPTRRALAQAQGEQRGTFKLYIAHQSLLYSTTYHAARCCPFENLIFGLDQKRTEGVKALVKSTPSFAPDWVISSLKSLQNTPAYLGRSGPWRRLAWYSNQGVVIRPL
jgi:hypothetical protein